MNEIDQLKTGVHWIYTRVKVDSATSAGHHAQRTSDAQSCKIWRVANNFLVGYRRGSKEAFCEVSNLTELREIYGGKVKTP